MHRMHRDRRPLSAGVIRLRFPGREQFPLTAVNFGVAEITIVRPARVTVVRVLKRMTRQGRAVVSRPRSRISPGMVNTPRERR